MKKIIMVFFALIIIFSVKNVFAQDQYELTLEKQNGIFMSRRGVNYDDDSLPYYIYKMNGMFAYCVEPGKHISTYTYIGTSDYIDLGFSEELKEKLELIGYYGRDYPGHDNVRYSMAAQALIWELTGVDKVTFWTELNEQGEEIDISKERNEIMNLVNNHKILPNFKNSYAANLNKELIINDTSKVLNNYEILDSDIENVYIENNNLHIIPKKIGTYNIKLKRKSYDEYNTIIFVGKGDNSSQKLGRLHFNKEITKNITINVSGIRLLVHKVDENNNPIRISNIKFKIKNRKTGEYICSSSTNCIYMTDSSSTFLTLPLNYGEYELEEVENQIVRGYTWNSEKVNIVISEDSIYKWNNSGLYNYIDIYFKNNSIPIIVEINKTGEKPIYDNDITIKEEKLSNISFDVYTSDNKYVETVTTDSNGKAIIRDLKIGKYYLIEKDDSNKYIDKGKISFTITQTDQYQTKITQKINIKNELKKGQLEFSKLDSKTNKGIINTVIEIYDENNKLLLTKTTDVNGKIIINNLPVGKYYIKEKEANYYYSKTSDVVDFEIKNDGDIIKKIMTNDKIMGKIEIEKRGEELKIIDNNIAYEKIDLADIEFYLYNDNNELINILKTNNDGKVSYELELGKYYLIEKTKLSNYRDNIDKYSFEIKKDGNKTIDVKITIDNYLKKGDVIFSKEELITHKSIMNTVMELYDTNDNLLLTKTTNTNGKIIINNLPLGNYYFKEKEANYFFKISDKKTLFEIKSDNELVNVNFTNERIKGNIEINKKGENYHFINNDIYYEKILLYGIEFEIFDVNDNLIDVIKTDNNGYAKYSNLPLGKYYLIEKTKLNQYVDNDEKYYFEIKKKDFIDAVDVTIDITNYLKKGGLEFLKIDSITKKGIADTIIEIYNDDDRLLFTKKTDEHGKIIINNLPVGKYYIKEKEANYNYQKTDKIIFFNIKDNNEIIKIEMENKKITGSLEINKYGEKYQIINDEMIYEKKELANIKFDLFDINDNYLATLETNKRGYVKYDSLALGKYYLIEKSDLADYVANNDKIYFEIVKENNKAIDVNLSIENYIKKGKLEFTKKDFVTGTGIENTIIEIYDQNNNLWFTKITDQDGNVIINNLPVGKYYIVEKEANSLYLITNEKVLFEIKEDGEIVKANMTNEKKEIPVPKTGTIESLITNTIFGISFLIGIGRMIYERKETY